MIAKVIANKANTSGSFKRLVNYITRESDDGKEFVKPELKNIEFEKLSAAIKEVEATQELNKRSKKSKTYHMVVSFPEGEKPSHKIIHEIEEELCKSIGFEGHQRISAIHDDTDNYHLHIAINKINPVTFNAVDPYYDKKVLVEKCGELEKKYNLTPVCSLKSKDKEQLSDKAKQMESHTDLESFESYLKENKDLITNALSGSKNWGEFYDELAKIGVGVKLSGAGAVFHSFDDKYHLACSRVDRSCTKSKFEAALGAFELNSKHGVTSAEYKPAMPKNELWDEFMKKTTEKKEARKNAFEDQKAMLSEAKEDYLLVKEDIKKGRKQTRRTRYKEAYAEYRKTTLAIRSSHNKKLKEIGIENPFTTWQSFLIHKSNKGNTAAIKALRNKKKYESGKDSDEISADHEGKPILDNHSYTADKRGVLNYKFSGASIEDNGDVLEVNLKLRKEYKGMLNALLFAKEKYGSDLIVNGDDAFKTLAVQVAVDCDLDIRFKDTNLENNRAALAKTKHIQNQVDSFIDKRNQTREKVTTILEHRRIKSNDGGEVTYQGMRRLKGVAVALYQRKNQMLVDPLSSGQEKIASRLKVGQKLKIEGSSVIFNIDDNKGRER